MASQASRAEVPPPSPQPRLAQLDGVQFLNAGNTGGWDCGVGRWLAASTRCDWRSWPHISSWAGSLWRLLNEELMDPAVSAHHPDADEVGGSG
jgi:hypothetical protein